MTFEKILTRYQEIPGYTGTIDEYVAHGGYQALPKALGPMQPADVIDAVKRSGLRGRGGAGFPCGVKWSFIPKDSTKPKYLVVNGDESEPGTFKDRMLIEEEPHQILEGVILASYAIGCHQAFLYCRGEFVRGAAVLRRALDEAYARG
ncbi:MAG: nuoF, partial [candidate division NC10 bacterium]|nr:nuoF [candidate division NC10 bacterium]